MNALTKKTLLTIAMGFGVAFVTGSTSAGEPPPPPPPKDVLCHNIGGPRDLGADCDGTGNCALAFDSVVITVPENYFFGIIIPFNESDTSNKLAAHLAHGDGFAIQTFDPPLHLASDVGPHIASNVECFALRAITAQPPEPGN